ncbi:hypothetical protein Tco_0185551 [Tanacetum coccineum]
MSSDNASSTVTYTFVSSDSNGPSSWGIPLVNVGELPEMDPYEEVTQQGQAHPLSPAYVPDPIELDEHVPVYVLKPEHPEYHAPSDDDIQVEDQPYTDDASLTAESPGYIADSDSMEEDTDEDSIDYPDEPGTDDEDDDEDPEAAMIRIRDDIPEEDMPPQRRFLLTTLLLGCDVSKSSAAAARAPRAADRAEDVSYVRALQASEHRMMTSIEEVNLRVSYQAQVRRQESEDFYTQLHDARTNRRGIRLEIDVVRGQRTAYETELHEVLQAYFSSKARNRALLARLETLETHMSHMEWQLQRAEDDAVKHIMHTQVLEVRARIDTVEDAGRTEGIVGLSQWIEKMESVFHISGCAVENQVKFATCTLLAYTQRFQELALMCTKFFADETTKIDKYIGGLPDNIHGNVMSVRPKTLDFAIELANDLMDQKLRPLARMSLCVDQRPASVSASYPPDE